MGLTRDPIHWLMGTDSGQMVRIAAGMTFFAVLAVVDWRRNGPKATRWREYGVLVIAVAAAMVYGAVNDQVTSSISWEYFYYGKDLEKVLGPTVPPEPGRLHWEAAKVGMKATWTVGLIIGVVLLLANNPWKGWRRLRYRELVGLLAVIVGTAVALGVVGGVLGYYGWLTWVSADFQDMTRADIFRPRRFICTWGVHLGGYVGGLLGMGVAVGKIVWKRRRNENRLPGGAG